MERESELTRLSERMTTTTIGVITFTIPGRAPAACSPNSRVNWRVRHADGKEYGDTVFLLAWEAKPPGWEPLERAEVTVTQRAVKLRDGDNLLTSFKFGLDAIVRAGILIDDKPSCVEIITVKHQKVRRKCDEEVHVRVVKL